MSKQQQQQQTVPTTPWWKNKKIILRIVVPVALGIIMLIALIAAAYHFQWSGAGFTSSHKTTTATTYPSKVVTTTIEEQPAKTLWDWLPLLIQLLGALAIPIVVGLGAAYIGKRQSDISEANRQQQHATTVQIAENQQQEEFLRTYVDKLSDLLLDEKLSTSPNIQSIVRARTLAALHILNTKRKAIVFRFLHDADLLQHVKGFLYSLDLSHTDLNNIDLRDANLTRANLRGADLSFARLTGANLSYANLSYANLRRANLSHTDLSGATLIFADLSDATLFFADLSYARLTGADLSDASLTYADLSDADLIEATVTSEQLKKANNVTPKQHAHIKQPPEPVAPQDAFTPLSQSETKPDHTSQEETEQPGHKQPEQDTDGAN